MHERGGVPQLDIYRNEVPINVHASDNQSQSARLREGEITSLQETIPLIDNTDSEAVPSDLM